jgi:hypothetical protein
MKTSAYQAAVRRERRTGHLHREGSRPRLELPGLVWQHNRQRGCLSDQRWWWRQQHEPVRGAAVGSNHPHAGRRILVILGCLFTKRSPKAAVVLTIIGWVLFSVGWLLFLPWLLLCWATTFQPAPERASPASSQRRCPAPSRVRRASSRSRHPATTCPRPTPLRAQGWSSRYWRASNTATSARSPNRNRRYSRAPAHAAGCGGAAAGAPSRPGRQRPGGAGTPPAGRTAPTGHRRSHFGPRDRPRPARTARPRGPPAGPGRSGTAHAVDDYGAADTYCWRSPAGPAHCVGEHASHGDDGVVGGGGVVAGQYRLNRRSTTARSSLAPAKCLIASP